MAVAMTVLVPVMSDDKKEEASWEKVGEIFDKILIEIEEQQRAREAIEELHKALEEIE